jgi:glutathione S-transferase
VACDPVMAEDARKSMPVFQDLDGTRAEGVWAILDHLEHHYPDIRWPRPMTRRGAAPALGGLGDGAVPRTGDPAHRL